MSTGMGVNKKDSVLRRMSVTVVEYLCRMFADFQLFCRRNSVLTKFGVHTTYAAVSLCVCCPLFPVLLKLFLSCMCDIKLCIFH